MKLEKMVVITALCKLGSSSVTFELTKKCFTFQALTKFLDCKCQVKSVNNLSFEVSKSRQAGFNIVSVFLIVRVAKSKFISQTVNFN